MNRRSFIARLVGLVAAAAVEFEVIVLPEFDSYWSQNIRRKIFYDYSNGASTLLALMDYFNKEVAKNVGLPPEFFPRG